MASKFFAFLALLLAFCTSKSLGLRVECESLDASACAYAVSSSGVRCVLEKSTLSQAYTCTASEIGAEGFNGWIEKDECVAACGIDRSTVGISSDSLLDANFRQKLCSSECFHGCPNVVNLYFNLAAGEGVFLPSLCGQPMSARREMAELRSSGGASLASGPAYDSAGKRLAYPPSQFPYSFTPAAEPPC